MDAARHDGARLPLDYRVERHDANQLELRLAYLLTPELRRQEYSVEAFVFVPRTLGINSRSYPSDRFYQDTAGYLRFKTPSVTLSALDGDSPWHRRVRAAAARHDGLERAIHRLKLLGCVYRSALREASAKLEAHIDAATDPGSLASQCAEYVFSTRRALTALRKLGEEMQAGPRQLRATWEAVDEYIALWSETVVTQIVARLDQRLERWHSGPLTAVRRTLADLALESYRWRSEREYRTVLEENSRNETLPYRARMLARTLTSALYLDEREEKAGRLAQNLAAMGAAAAAMLVAVLIAMWAQLELGMFSSAFVVVMVASYMLKDRIKDWGRHLLGRKLARWMPDRASRVRAPGSTETLAECNEVVGYVSRPPREILAARFADHPSPVAPDGRPEHVLRYSKHVRIEGPALADALDGSEGVRDILRLDLGHLRTRMDSPSETYLHLHPRTREVMRTECARVYHINLVLRFAHGADQGRADVIERVRIVMDQSGILRTEQVPLGAEGHAAPSELEVGAPGGWSH